MAGKNKDDQRPEIVYCTDTTCYFNRSRGKCGIVHTINGDDKISVGPGHLCLDYVAKKK